MAVHTHTHTHTHTQSNLINIKENILSNAVLRDTFQKHYTHNVFGTCPLKQHYDIKNQ